MLVRTVGTVTDLRVLPAFCECQDHFHVLQDLEGYCQTEKLAITMSSERDIVQLVKYPLRITIGPESDILHFVKSPLRITIGLESDIEQLVKYPLRITIGP